MRECSRRFTESISEGSIIYVARVQHERGNSENASRAYSPNAPLAETLTDNEAPDGRRFAVLSIILRFRVVFCRRSARDAKSTRW